MEFLFSFSIFFQNYSSYQQFKPTQELDTHDLSLLDIKAVIKSEHFLYVQFVHISL